MNFDKEKVRGLLILINAPMLLLNSLAYCTDLMFNLKIIDTNIELMVEQIFIINYVIIFISNPSKIQGIVIFSYLMILSLLIMVNEYSIINPFISKIFSIILLLIMTPMIIVEIKKSLRIIIAKNRIHHH